MARPKSIPWETRVNVFLSYRLLGKKVYPVAKRYGVARSTVTLIVKEFVDLGFSSHPRPNLSTQTLRTLQELHLEGLVSQLRDPSVASDTGGEPMGLLDLTPATNEDAAREALTKNPLYIQDELEWHLGGNKAEEVFREARHAAAAFHQQDHRAWHDLREKLEGQCRLPVRESLSDIDHEPHILPGLVHLLRNAFFDAKYHSQPPASEWEKWVTDPEAPIFLRADGQRVAVGNSDDHESVRSGVTAFLVDDFRGFQRRFKELERLRLDLRLLHEVVEDAFKGVKEQDVRRGICPACVYPEAIVNSESTSRTSKLNPKRRE